MCLFFALISITTKKLRKIAKKGNIEAHNLLKYIFTNNIFTKPSLPDLKKFVPLLTRICLKAQMSLKKNHEEKISVKNSW